MLIGICCKDSILRQMNYPMLHYAKIYTNFYWKNTQNNTIVLFQERCSPQ
jgi:hypothetical protein